jgi:hypothetical protein
VNCHIVNVTSTSAQFSPSNGVFVTRLDVFYGSAFSPVTTLNYDWQNFIKCRWRGLFIDGDIWHKNLIPCRIERNDPKLMVTDCRELVAVGDVLEYETGRSFAVVEVDRDNVYLEGPL